jgi:hypothetical protein
MKNGFSDEYARGRSKRLCFNDDFAEARKTRAAFQFSDDGGKWKDSSQGGGLQSRSPE